MKHYGEKWSDLEELQYFVSVIDAADGPAVDQEANLVREAADEEPILVV